MRLLEGHRGLVVGVANRHSLAWGIAEAAHRHGAHLALCQQNDRLRERTRPLAEALGAWTLTCDVSDDAHIAQVARDIGERWGGLDFVVHAVAGARREELEGDFVDTTRPGFALAHDVSVYSLVALARALRPLLAASPHASVLTLSYIGAERAVPSYNVMGVAKAALEAAVRYLAADLGPAGVRVNAISAGPVKTLSASAVRGLGHMLAHVEAAAPLRRGVGLAEVGDAAVCLLSPLMRATTAEVVHVDAGFHGAVYVPAPGRAPLGQAGAGPA